LRSAASRVEPEVFAWAARADGFTGRAHHEPGASALGHTQLTIDQRRIPSPKTATNPPL
jgi:hypothetical protein